MATNLRPTVVSLEEAVKANAERRDMAIAHNTQRFCDRLHLDDVFVVKLCVEGKTYLGTISVVNCPSIELADAVESWWTA